MYEYILIECRFVQSTFAKSRQCCTNKFSRVESVAQHKVIYNRERFTHNAVESIVSL